MEKCVFERVGSLFLGTEEHGLKPIPNDVEELGKCLNVHFRKVITLEFGKVAVVADNIGGFRRNGTIHEFIVVGVGSDKIEAIRRIDALHVFSICNGFYYKRSKLWVARLFQDYV